MLSEFHIFFFACLRNKHIGETSKLSSNVVGVLKNAPSAEESQRMDGAHVSVCLVTEACTQAVKQLLSACR